jgi:type III restriction enzyme
VPEVPGRHVSAQLKYKALADAACERIVHAIVRSQEGRSEIKAVLDPYNAVGSTMHVNFASSKPERWQTGPDRCHVNWVILDSNWEGELCRIVEKHPRVRSYVKNHGLGFEVPYRLHGEARAYRPDFIVVVDDGRGENDLLNLVVEVKGYRGEDAKEKKATMENYWVPGVNRLGRHGRWAFVELTDPWSMQDDFAKLVDAVVVSTAEAI